MTDTAAGAATGGGIAIDGIANSVEADKENRRLVQLLTKQLNNERISQVEQEELQLLLTQIGLTEESIARLDEGGTAAQIERQRLIDLFSKRESQQLDFDNKAFDRAVMAEETFLEANAQNQQTNTGALNVNQDTVGNQQLRAEELYQMGLLNEQQVRKMAISNSAREHLLGLALGPGANSGLGSKADEDTLMHPRRGQAGMNGYDSFSRMGLAQEPIPDHVRDVKDEGKKSIGILPATGETPPIVSVNPNDQLALALSNAPLVSSNPLERKIQTSGGGMYKGKRTPSGIDSILQSVHDFNRSQIGFGGSSASYSVPDAEFEQYLTQARDKILQTVVT